MAAHHGRASAAAAAAAAAQADGSRTPRADGSRTPRADGSRTPRADGSRTPRADGSRTPRTSRQHAMVSGSGSGSGQTSAQTPRRPMSRVPRLVQRPVTRKEAGRLFDLIDTDGSGWLSLKELSEALKSWQASSKAVLAAQEEKESECTELRRRATRLLQAAVRVQTEAMSDPAAAAGHHHQHQLQHQHRPSASASPPPPYASRGVRGGAPRAAPRTRAAGGIGVPVATPRVHRAALHSGRSDSSADSAASKGSKGSRGSRGDQATTSGSPGVRHALKRKAKGRTPGKGFRERTKQRRAAATQQQSGAGVDTSGAAVAHDESGGTPRVEEDPYAPPMAHRETPRITSPRMASAAQQSVERGPRAAPAEHGGEAFA
jgi:hypothetical protein